MSRCRDDLGKTSAESAGVLRPSLLPSARSRDRPAQVAIVRIREVAYVSEKGHSDKMHVTEQSLKRQDRWEKGGTLGQRRVQRTLVTLWPLCLLNPVPVCGDTPSNLNSEPVQIPVGSRPPAGGHLPGVTRVMDPGGRRGGGGSLEPARRV